MAFKFSLATVLRVRVIAEEREERLLQKILYEISQLNRAMRETEEAIAASNVTRLADRFKPVVGRHLHVSYGGVEELRQKRSDIEGQLEKFEQLRTIQVKAYEAARRDREMLTDMREEKRGVYDVALSRSEQKTLDDNYIARRGRF